MPSDAARPVVIRHYGAQDGEYLAAIAHRLHPGETVSPRDPEAEGMGIGRALMCHIEGWARTHDCLEVVLDVFAGNAGAIAFYERNGYRPDHIRMAKPLV